MLDRLRRRLMLPMALSNALSATATGAIYLYLVWLVARGERTVGDLVLYGGAATLLQMHLLDLGLSFSTVRMADQILVIDGGRIIEAGSHAELIARDGRYAALYEMQAGRYRSE
jgi:hypothetical protein